MDEKNKEVLQKQFSHDNMAVRYQQAIKYFADGSKTGTVDKQEYKMFQEMTLKRDVTALAHAYLQMVFSFDEYWDRLQALVAWDLMIQGLIDGSVKQKSNGEE